MSGYLILELRLNVLNFLSLFEPENVLNMFLKMWYSILINQSQKCL